MNRKTLIGLVVVSLIAAGSLYLAEAQTNDTAGKDPRLDKILEQNERIIKGQEEIQKTLGELKQDLLQLRRRSS